MRDAGLAARNMRDRFRLFSSESVPPHSKSSPGGVDNGVSNEVLRAAVVIEPRRHSILWMMIHIGIVFLLLAGVATVAVPSLIRSRKRSAATMLMDDIRQLEQAVDLYTNEWVLIDGNTRTWAQIRARLKAGSRLNPSSAAPAPSPAVDAVAP